MITAPASSQREQREEVAALPIEALLAVGAALSLRAEAWYPAGMQVGRGARVEVLQEQFDSLAPHELVWRSDTWKALEREREAAEGIARQLFEQIQAARAECAGRSKAVSEETTAAGYPGKSVVGRR